MGVIKLFLAIAGIALGGTVAEATVLTCTFRSDANPVYKCSIDTSNAQPCNYTYTANLSAACSVVALASQCVFNLSDGTKATGLSQTLGASFGARYAAPGTPDYNVLCQ
jgi:hypothetical protein